MTDLQSISVPTIDGTMCDVVHPRTPRISDAGRY